MIVLYRNQILKELYVWLFLSLLFLIIPLGWEVFFSSEEKLNFSEVVYPAVMQETRLAYPELGNVFFSGSDSSFSFPDLKEELDLYLLKKRPDRQDKDFILLLKEAKQSIYGNYNERINLRYGSDGKLCESIEPSLFWITVQGEKEQICLNACLQDLEEEACRVTFLKKNLPSDKLSAVFQKTQRISFLGKDLFQEKKGRSVFVFEQEGAPLLVEKDSIWVWEKGRWRIPKKGEETHPQTIASLQNIKEMQAELCIWNPEGAHQIVNLALQPSIVPQPNIQEVLSNIHFRTFTKISLFLGQKIYFLQEKEALVKTPKGWKKMQEGQEPVSGEIFLFDSISLVDGKKIFHGQWFNPLHTQGQVISFPISSFQTFDSKPMQRN